MNEIVAYSLGVAGFASVMYLAYLCDKALERRQRSKFNKCGLGEYTFTYVPPLEMVCCGGCGKSIEPGTCEGPEKCEKFLRNA